MADNVLGKKFSNKLTGEIITIKHILRAVLGVSYVDDTGRKHLASIFHIIWQEVN